MDGTVTRRLGKDVTVGLQAGFASGSSENLGVGPVNDIVIDPFTRVDVTAFLTSKHLEVRAFADDFYGFHSLDAEYVGQGLLPARFNLKVADVEAQYIDQLETGKDVVHDLHVGGAYRIKQVDWTYQAQSETENHVGFFIHDEIKIARRFAVVGDYRADYVPYLNRIVQSPRGSVLWHPSRRATLRASVGTAFRTPTFFESYLNVPEQLPIAGGALDEPPKSLFRLNPEHVVTTELGYLNSDSDYFTVDTAVFYNHVDNIIELAPNIPITVGDLLNPGVPTGLQTTQGVYPIFIGGFDNQCQTYDLVGSEIGLRTFPIEGLDVYANTTLMDVKQNNGACTTVQVSDARTSAVKVNTGIQLRTRIGFDGSVDFHYVSQQTWAEQVVDVQQQRIEYQSFHLDPYELLNASVGFRFLKNQAEIRAVGFNLLDDRHREHPFGQVLDRRFMGIFSYKF